MSTISINDLQLVGSTLFSDSESFLNDLSEEITDSSLKNLKGGTLQAVTAVAGVTLGAAAFGGFIGQDFRQRNKQLFPGLI